MKNADDARFAARRSRIDAAVKLLLPWTGSISGLSMKIDRDLDLRRSNGEDRTTSLEEIRGSLRRHGIQLDGSGHIVPEASPSAAEIVRAMQSEPVGQGLCPFAEGYQAALAEVLRRLGEGT